MAGLVCLQVLPSQPPLAIVAGWPPFHIPPPPAVNRTSMRQPATGMSAAPLTVSSIHTVPPVHFPYPGSAPSGRAGGADNLHSPMFATGIVAAAVVAFILIAGVYGLLTTTRSRRRLRPCGHTGGLSERSLGSTAKLSMPASSLGNNLQVPQSAMNPAFEYALPRHLALLATTQRLTGSYHTSTHTTGGSDVSTPATRAPDFHPAYAFNTHSAVSNGFSSIRDPYDDYEMLPMPPLQAGAVGRLPGKAQPLSVHDNPTADRQSPLTTMRRTDLSGLFQYLLRSEPNGNPSGSFSFDPGGTLVAATDTVMPAAACTVL